MGCAAERDCYLRLRTNDDYALISSKINYHLMFQINYPTSIIVAL